MTMKRRDFSTQLLVASVVTAAWSSAAQAQGAGPSTAWVEGKDFLRLGTPLAVPAGKIEVVDFFWYGCPHCYSFEPALDAWSKKLGTDVAFRRLPVMFREEPFGAHARLFYALEALGLVDSMHRKVFAAIHNEKLSLAKPAEISALMTKNGVDGAKVVDTMSSFSVQTKVLKSRQIAEAFKLDGVPALGIQGQFLTSLWPWPTA
jgi:protein dithiol oxidoreductase (disulfide-forming)